MIRVTCPLCNFSSQVDPARVPPGAATALCPKCGQRFAFSRDEAVRTASSPQGKPPAGPGGAVPAPGSLRPTGSQAFRTRLMADFTEGIPWEDPEHGLFRDLSRTIGLVLFHPDDFFRRMPRGGGWTAPLAFGLITGSVGLILSWYWPLFLGAMLWEASPFQEIGLLSFLEGGGAVILVVVAPFLVALGLVGYSAVVHLMLLLVMGGGGGFQATFRVLAYSQAALLFNIVPVVGGLAGGLWLLVLEVLGLSRAHDIGLFRAVFALLILPFLLVLLLVLAVILLVGLLVF